MAQPDYYALLGVEATASSSEITRAWRRMVLITHPDKQGGSTADDADIRLINEARAVLSDPSQRAEYDLKREQAPRRASPPPTSGPRIREYVSLEAFTPHAEEGESEPHRYTYECRCGHDYAITLGDLEAGVDVIGCPGCGEFIGVEYEVVEE